MYTFEIIMTVVILVTGVIALVIQNRLYDRVRDSNLKTMVFKLFLYAEKQDWVGPEKMAFCVDKIAELTKTSESKKEALKYAVQVFYEEYKDMAEALVEDVETQKQNTKTKRED